MSATRQPIIPAFMTQAAYARHRGVSRQAVHLAIKRGKISLSENGLICVREADIAWAVVPATGRPPKVLEKVC